MNNVHGQRGYLLVTVVVALFLIAAIAVLLAQDSAMSANSANREIETERAEYVTQAGLQHALWRVDNNACTGNTTLPVTMLGPDQYSATVTGASPGTNHVLTPDQDAWIRSDDTSRNNGTGATNHVKFESGNIEQMLTRFDLTALPVNAQISSATAWFHLNANQDHPEGAIAVHAITADWAETDVTWASFDGAYSNTVLATIPAQENGDVWVSINLTGQVQAWVNGQANYGLLFATLAEGIHTQYAAREDASHPPRIEVVVGSGPVSPVNVQATGTLANGVSRTFSRPLSTAYQPPLDQTFSPGSTASNDAEIWAQSPDNNYGDAAETWVSSLGNDTTRSLLRFNTAAIPAGARILEATLLLERQSGSGAAIPVSAHRILNSWSEDSVTWNSRESGISWDTAGGDINTHAVAMTMVGSGSQVHEWDIASLVQGWIDGSFPNYGVALIAATDGSAGQRFYTSDQAIIDRRPSLAVRYACECGNACMAPQGTGTVLLVRNGNNPDPTDSLKQKMLEDWGYTVNLLDDWDDQATYDAAMANNDVVFVSGASPFGVGSKLNNAPIGVVNERGDLNDELGIATGRASSVGDTVDVIDTTHFITGIFTSGTIQVTPFNVDLATVSGTLAPGAQQLAQIGGAGALVALDVGAISSGGGASAARRVTLPNGESPVDWLMTNSGQLIVQRSLTWAMNADQTTTGKLLLVVGDASNPPSKDEDRKTLFESWGYAVTLIDDGDSQANFDAAVAANDITYVSNSIGVQLGGKLDNITAGIVSEDPENLDNFGFGSQVPPETLSTDNFSSTDTAHYISAPFAGASVTLFTSNFTMPLATGTLAPGLQAPGLLSSGFAGDRQVLVALDAGAQRWDSVTSAGRRVHLPFGPANVSQLSSDGLTLMQRSIEWASGTGCGSKIPLALLVADATSPTAEEATRKTLLESWCYAVSLMTAAEPQAVYDTLTDNYDVVYVPSSVDYADVTSKLKLQPVGIVNEVTTLTAYLGFTSGSSGYTGTVTELVDNSHFITSGLPLGNLALTTSATSLRHFTNTMGPGFRTLFVRPTQTNPMIMTLDFGDELLWGGEAPDRRVMLPWGGSSSFDVNELSDDGLTILRRAIEWVAAPEPPLAPVAHWKLDEIAGTTAVDSIGGHDGTLTLGPAWTPGQLDGALNFDGNNDYVDVPHNDSLALTGKMTFTAWVNASNYGSSYQTIVSRDSGVADSNYWFGTWRDELVFGFWSGGFFREVETFGLALQEGAWYHLAATFDNTSNEVRLIVDGTVVRTGVLTQTLGTPTAPVWLGRSIDGEYWEGLLDDVRIYDDVLTIAEIAVLVAEAKAGGGGGNSSCKGNFRDEFNAESYGNNDGSLSWSTDWLEINENDGWDSGDERVDDNDSTFHLQLRDNDGGGEGVQREADLSNSTSATFTFEYRRDGFDNDGDFVMVLVSPDGGSSWTELERISGPGTDSIYVPRSHDISGHIAPDTRIRFLTSPNHGSGDELYVDNIEIAVSGCAN